MFRIFTLFILIWIGTNAYAQTCCTGGVPLLGSYIPPQSATKNDLGIHVVYNYNQNADLISHNQLIQDSHVTRKIHTTLTQIDFNPLDKFSISITLPFLWQEEITEGPTGTTTFANNGLGDVTVWLGYHTEHGKSRITGAFGLKAPVGRTDAKDAATGITYPFSLQNGSGSWDIGANLFVSSYLGNSKKFSIENQLSARINTPGRSFEAHENYRFGHQFQLLSAGSYHFLLHTIVSDIFGGFAFQYRTKDIFDGGFDNENTGGNWLNLTFGGNFFLYPELFLNLNAVIPIYRDLNGLQLSTSWQCAIGINYIVTKS